MKILIPDVIKDKGNIESQIFGPDYEILVCDVTSANEIKNSVWEEAVAILAFDQLNYDKDLVKKLKNCKSIVRVGVGYDNVDLTATKESGIIVSNVPDYGTEEVADHTMGMLLNLSRGIKEYSRNVEEKNWDRKNELPIRLRGKTLGIIGCGRIGTATALRAKSFGLNIIFFDPYVSNGFEKSIGAQRVHSLKDLAQLSNFISIHTPINDETKNIINEEFFINVREGTYLVNTARGGLIELKALESAMKSKKIKAAALDVLPNEPNNGSQSLINALENQEDWIKNRLIITPHVAFYSPEAFTEMRTSAAKEALRVLTQLPPLNRVN